MPHHIGHLITSVAALAATLVISSLTPNTLVRRKLRLSTVIFAACLWVGRTERQRPQEVPISP